MNLESKALPLIAVLIVVFVAGVVLYGKGLFDTSPDAGPAGGSDPQPVALHAKQQEARTAIREGRFDDAREALMSVPESDPAYPRVLTDLAVFYDTRRNAEAALAMGSKLVSIEPENAEAHFVLGRAYLAMGDGARAEAHALRAVEIAPTHKAARYTLGLIRLAQGQVDRSIDAYIRAMRYGSEQTDVDTALADLTDLEQKRPGLQEVHYVLAFFANSLGAKDQEMLELERFLETSPQGPVADAARNRLAELQTAAP